MRSFIRKGTALAFLLLFGAAGCADLEVTNPNAADRERALATPGDVESLVGGSWATLYNGYNSFAGAGQFLSVQAFEHSASWNNFCMVPCGALPRPELQNDPAWSYYDNISRAWDRSYRSLAAVADAFRALEDPEIAEGVDVDRMRAFGRYMQGISHGMLAVFYDQAFIVDETLSTDADGLPQVTDPVAYPEVLSAALGYLDQAIDLASGKDFTIPSAWVNTEMSADELAQLASTYKARLRAAVARTPAEREAVDWNAVLTELDNGIAERHLEFNYSDWFNGVIYYGNVAGWAWLDYMIWGMADQSGDVQAWWDLPVGDRLPQIDGDPVRIVTPDERFPQGNTIDAQISNPGTVFEVSTTTHHSSISETWQKPDRGTWRWSWYRAHGLDGPVFSGTGTIPEVNADEIRLLRAEAYYRMDQTDMAADLIDVTRTAAGLDPIADGENASCVPRLPDGTCGDLFEALKWEKRIETRMVGLFHAGAYLDSRGWGDLYMNTQTSLPVPCGELQILAIDCYNVGGGVEHSAPMSSYEWPHEG